MSTETLLRLSLIQAELRKLAAGLDGGQAKVLTQAASLLNLLGACTQKPAPGVVSLVLVGREVSVEPKNVEHRAVAEAQHGLFAFEPKR